MAELMDLISEEKSGFLCFQEVMVSIQTNLNLKYCNGVFKEGNTNYRAHGGVVIFFHETISYQKLTLYTPLQVKEAKITIGRDVTIVSFYCNLLSNDISEKLLSPLFQQPPTPVLLTGDFKS